VRKALAKEFDCKLTALPTHLDLLVKSEIFNRRPQRQNPLGIGFVIALSVALEQFSAKDYTFLPEEAIGITIFKGIQKPPRAAPDIVVVKEDDEFAIISAKWSVRHDRLKDILDEADYFKRLRPKMPFYVATNEYDPARLNKIIEDYRID